MRSPIQFLVCLLFSVFVIMPAIGQGDYESPFSRKKNKTERQEQGKVKIGYKSFTEGGILVPNLDFEQRTFSGFSSHGIYFNNAYLGAGIGFDKYDTISLLPLVLDGRYIFTGRARSQFNNGPIVPRGFNLFVFFSGGFSKNISQNQAANSNGLILQCGMGMLIGKLEDARFTLTFGYKYQELPKGTPPAGANQYDSFNIKLGIEFRT